MNGKIVKFISNKELSDTWQFQDMPELVLIHYTWRFELLGKNRTKVILRHSGFTEDREKFDESSQGWTWIVNWLGNYLTKGGR